MYKFKNGLWQNVFPGPYLGGIGIRAGGSPPTLRVTAASIDGSTVTISFNNAVTVTGYTAGDMFITIDSTDYNLTYSSGTGTKTLVFTSASAAVYGDSVVLSFDGGSTIFTDANESYLAVFSDSAVANNTAEASTSIYCAGYSTDCTISTYPGTNKVGSSSNVYTFDLPSVAFSGTATAVRIYFGYTWDASATYPVLYKQTASTGDFVLVGEAGSVTPSVNSWVEYELTQVSGQSLSFSAGDTLRPGVAFASTGYWCLMQDTVEGIYTRYYTADMSAGPPSIISGGWLQNSNRSIGIMLKYEG